jgi:hypothetical protein
MFAVCWWRSTHYTADVAATTRPSAQNGPSAGGVFTAARGRRGSLSRHEFFAAVAERVRPALPSELSGFRQRANMALLKIDYGNERVHFEVWTDGARNRVEIGLHFEDGPASTAAYLAYFDGRIVEIKHHLGWEIELERWTLSWGHLFESIPLAPLERRFAADVADRLARQIALLQPMVVEAAIPSGQHDPPTIGRRRWRSRSTS